MTEPRFFIDHGMIHDRETGKHITTEPDSPFCDGIQRCCELLNALAERREPKPFPLLFDNDWLQEKIRTDPDVDCEAGPALSSQERQSLNSAQSVRLCILCGRNAVTYKHEGPFESFLDGKIPNIPESGMTTRNRTECLLNDAMDYIAGTLEQPNNPHAWDHLLIYCPREIIERRVAAFAPAVQERSISPYPDLELWNTRRILELLVSRFNFDGMDPNSFTISELRRAATGKAIDAAMQRSPEATE